MLSDRPEYFIEETSELRRFLGASCRAEKSQRKRLLRIMEHLRYYSLKEFHIL